MDEESKREREREEEWEKQVGDGGEEGGKGVNGEGKEREMEGGEGRHHAACAHTLTHFLYSTWEVGIG